MNNTYSVLPFYFRKLENINKYLLTNIQGSYIYLDSENSVEALIETNIDIFTHEIKNELLAKNFLAEHKEVNSRISLIASKFATSTASQTSKPSLFMVVPTLRCDHKCSYCQVSRVDKHKSGYDLDIQHIDKI